MVALEFLAEEEHGQQCCFILLTLLFYLWGGESPWGKKKYLSALAYQFTILILLGRYICSDNFHDADICALSLVKIHSISALESY